MVQVTITIYAMFMRVCITDNLKISKGTLYELGNYNMQVLQCIIPILCNNINIVGNIYLLLFLL